MAALISMSMLNALTDTGAWILRGKEDIQRLDPGNRIANIGLVT
jgi:hypothetical protein